MSQQLSPLNGGVQKIQTTTTQLRVGVLSQQFIQANGLESRLTEWAPGGRPIYRRLPAISETYQIDFFNLVPPANTAARFDGIQDIGYVYIPWGEGINGAISLEVVASDSLEDILIKSGTVVWRYGSSEVIPAIVNLKDLDLGSGRYLVAYQLVYDNAPVNHLYYVEDFALTGQPLTITSSSDGVIGWRYMTQNAFLNTDTLFWSNRDTYFPPYAQPGSAFMQWKSDLASAYSKIILRCPKNFSYSGTASLFYVDGSNSTFVSEVAAASDPTGQYFEFSIREPVLQTSWRIEFSSLDVAIQSVTVTGAITQTTQPSGPSPRSALVIYPANQVPETVINVKGEEVPATYCQLAYIDVNSSYQLEDIVDVRYIIHRDYQPVANWLTEPFDSNLIDLYEQVSAYPQLWMAPPNCMRQEYLALEKEQVVIQ
jgi:hypothetical protein